MQSFTVFGNHSDGFVGYVHTPRQIQLLQLRASSSHLIRERDRETETEREREREGERVNCHYRTDTTNPNLLNPFIADEMVLGNGESREH